MSLRLEVKVARLKPLLLGIGMLLGRLLLGSWGIELLLLRMALAGSSLKPVSERMKPVSERMEPLSISLRPVRKRLKPLTDRMKQ